MLLNIDIPNGTAKLHDETCRTVPKPFGTPLKPIGGLGENGGWFKVDTSLEAESIVRKEFPRAKLANCQVCGVVRQ